MAYENPLMAELMVPRDAEVAIRLHGFYQAIGWTAQNATDSEFFTCVYPNVSEGTPPTVAYWQTETVPGKIEHFDVNDEPEPTIFARGLRLPNLQELVEVCLVVPSDDDVHAIFDEGGKILERHTHILPRDHAGRQEFRFGDPFNYALRVTADPGWEIPDRVDAAPRDAEPKIEYNPERACLLPDSDGGKELIPVVTRDHLSSFLKEIGKKPGAGERVVNALAFATRSRPELKGFLCGREAEFNFQVAGIRVDNFMNVVSLLKADRQSKIVRNVGPACIELLEEYSKVLFTGLG